MTLSRPRQSLPYCLSQDFCVGYSSRRSLVAITAHRQRVPQRIQYKLRVLVHGCLNGATPGYLSDLTVSVASAARRQLRSASSFDLVVPSTRRASIGDRAFAVAGPRAWNSLPPALRSTSASFITFKKELKSFLFGLSFCLWQRILFIDYVQRSSSSLYRILLYRNCLNYITLHYIKPITRVSSQFICQWVPERRASRSKSPTAECSETISWDQ